MIRADCIYLEAGWALHAIRKAGFMTAFVSSSPRALCGARCFWTCLQEARHICWHAGDVTVLSKVFCIRQEASPNPGCIFLAKRIK